MIFRWNLETLVRAAVFRQPSGLIDTLDGWGYGLPFRCRGGGAADAPLTAAVRAGVGWQPTFAHVAQKVHSRCRCVPRPVIPTAAFAVRADSKRAGLALDDVEAARLADFDLIDSA